MPREQKIPLNYGMLKGSLKGCFKGSIGFRFRGLQHPLIKEYGLNYIGLHIMI